LIEVTPFEEDVFEPECPYGEKTFMQQHPLFGDFGVKVAKPGAGLVESPEHADLEALNDDDDAYVLSESPEADNVDALNDPEEQGFDDRAFDTPRPDEPPLESFEPQDFETTEQAAEEAPENP